MRRTFSLLLSTLFLVGAYAQNPTFQGQAPAEVVPTESRPVIKQWKGTWEFDNGQVLFSNDFDGARLNGVTESGQDEYTVLISAENIPINPSPWYAFKVWSKTPKTIKVLFTYENSRSRYYPKISKDPNGLKWEALDTAKYEPINMGEGAFGMGAQPEKIRITLDIDDKPTWIAAQEITNSSHVKTWINEITLHKDASQEVLGRSKEGREMHVVSIGKGKSDKSLMIISRQHPPEVTGYLAMQAFVETLLSETPTAKKFRKKFNIYVVPLMNPDGVDNGHWRHNMGGIDLNRDWYNFNQPETTNVKNFLAKKTEEGDEFVFGIDFHSTWDDIYYTVDSSFTDNKGGIMYEWLRKIDRDLPNYTPNIRPSQRMDPTLVSRNFFFRNYDMAALVFELGDNTDRTFLKRKGEVAAIRLMELLLRDE